jgi:hypothetical protein
MTCAKGKIRTHDSEPKAYECAKARLERMPPMQNRSKKEPKASVVGAF